MLLTTATMEAARVGAKLEQEIIGRLDGETLEMFNAYVHLAYMLAGGWDGGEFTQPYDDLVADSTREARRFLSTS